ncbi:MAG: phage holin family protein [Candidatus Peribacteraceae bacterium]|nr:phage holin family protein [Candidatus Peribacteraceae bacterium]MDD5075289.1 phage holin family protein [Candidatus Peribacteraceae bacterium]
MSDNSSSGSLPLRITIKAVLNIFLVWLMATYLDQYFQLTGGWRAIIIIAALITLLNLIVRPVLAIITIPLRLFATILAVIIVNGLFVWFTQMMVEKMDPAIVQLEIFGGLWGWIVVAVILGFANWLEKEMLK